MPNNLLSNQWLLTGILVGGVAAVTYYLSRKNKEKEADEGFSEKGTGEPVPKKILVLGLDGSGKTCLLRSLSKQTVQDNTTSTHGFNVINLENAKGKLEIWEIGGSEALRKYWSKFIEDTSILVFVVDASDGKRFPEAYDEMHKLLGEPRLLEKPFIVLANKQDISGAANVLAIKTALGLEDIKHHGVKILPTSFSQTPPLGLESLHHLLETL